MAIQIHNTNDVAQRGVNICVYSPAGSGKTTLIQTMRDYNPLILSAESGLLSIKGTGMSYIDINNLDDLSESFRFITESEEAKKFGSVAIDSASEIAEVCLSVEKKLTKDGRQAYMIMADKIATIIRAFRDIPIHVYMTAKSGHIKDENGALLYSPVIPGEKAAQNLPYFYDFLFPIRIWKDEESGEVQRMLQTQPDGVWAAKARDNLKVLKTWEEMDLGAIIKKIEGGAA